MQVCPYTVSTRQGNRPSSSGPVGTRLVSSGEAYVACGDAASHLTLRRYCRFFRLKPLRDMHGGGHNPEVLKELCTALDLAPRATKFMARSLGRAMSTLVVQERHLWLCLVDIGTPT